jgi:hypothetical protein
MLPPARDRPDVPEPARVPPIPHPRELVPTLVVEVTTEWFICGRPASDARQGWKLYVPLTMLNARDVVERLVPLLAPTGLQFKYVKNIKTLRKLNSGAFGYPQIGKCFTIYMPKPDGALILALKDVLAAYRDQCPAVPCARAFGDDLPLYYRYGSYVAEEIEIGDAVVYDDRTSLANAAPDGVEDAFAPYTTPARRDPAIASFLRGYPIFRALRQAGKGGVFHAMNLASPTFQEVALKVGYHRGQVQIDGSDGCTFLRRERAVYRYLAANGLAHVAPALIAELDVPRKVILVLEYVDGPTLLECSLGGTLTTEHLERSWAIMEELHAGRVYLGDAKLANFLLTADGDLRVLDFEAAGVVGDEPPAIRTFLLEPELEDRLVADKAHFLASILFPYEEGRYAREDRVVDVHAWLERTPGDEVATWAQDRLRALYEGDRRAEPRRRARFPQPSGSKASAAELM